jgi:hypothetical protein
MKPFRTFLPALLLCFTSSLQAEVMIDSFGTPSTLSYGGVSFASTTTDDASVLGGERDAILFFDTGTATSLFNTSGTQAISTPASNSSSLFFIYDGNDNNAFSTNYTNGLGSVDLTESMFNTGFSLTVGTSVNASASAVINVYSGSSTVASTYTMTFTPNVLTDYYVNFSAFTPVSGGTGSANFSNVTAISLEIESNPNSLVTVDNFKTTVAPVPEPSSLMLVASAVGMTLLRRRRKVR